ncbi:hypothetical protein M378DRAFT_863015 [Amanita muscaria Koide BX008]|uniref:F-box domain-containing protein n=1 Tax=Amanita muscaria (strain Koide BX008) TaxID=946122 RepID=A0A0C2SDR7_AMAMK|nr:hypothetical protein M378DRAFT_863015 [Amanita muscaria Koide BX008]
MSSNSSIDAGHSHEHQFPNEIIDEVVDHLQGNNEALKTIALSSRNFLHRARKHLFAAFVLKAPNKKDTPVSSLPSRKIFRLIKSAPHLIPYIQILEIACPGNTTWLKFDKQLSKALGLFQQTLETEIATFSIRHLYLNNITWSELSIDVQAAIQRLLGFRTLEMVTFYRTSDVPWTVLKEISSNVRALTLESACFWPEVEPEDSDTDDEWCEDDIGPLRDSTQAPLTEEGGIDRLRIEALHIAHGTLGDDPTIIFAHDSVCPLNVTHLRTFWVHVRSDYWCLWIRHQEFISHVGRSLETLGINFGTSLTGLPSARQSEALACSDKL